MCKGVFGKIFYLIIGIIVGMVLLVGGVSGGVYFALQRVTAGELEDYTGKDIFETDKENQTLLDIGKILLNLGKNFDTATIADLEESLGLIIPDILILDKASGAGIDLTKIKQSNLSELNVAVEEALKNVELGVIASSTGLILPNIPIVQNNINVGVIEALNNIMAVINPDELTLRQLEKHFNISIKGVKAFEAFYDTPLNNIGEEFNDLTLDEVIEINRDLYIKQGNIAEKKYIDYSAEEHMDWIRYNKVENEIGDISYEESVTGGYVVSYSYEVYVDNSTLVFETVEPLSRRATLYVKTGEIYSQANTAYDINTEYYIRQTVKTTINEVEEISYIYVPCATGKANFELNEDGTTGNFVMNEGGEYVQYHIGTAEKALQVLADTKISELGEGLGDKILQLEIGDIMEINDESSQILKNLKNVKILEIDTHINAMKISEIVEISETSPLILKTLGNSSLTSLADDINLLKLGDAIEIITTEEAALTGKPASPLLLQSLKGTIITELSGAIEILSLDEMVEIVMSKDSTPEKPASSFILQSLAKSTLANIGNNISTLTVAQIIENPTGIFAKPEVQAATLDEIEGVLATQMITITLNEMYTYGYLGDDPALGDKLTTILPAYLNAGEVPIGSLTVIDMLNLVLNMIAAMP